jgi:hypothetical protein
VDSDRLINGIKAGNALSLLKLKELSFQDKYIDGLYRKQTKDSKLLNNSMVQDRLYAKAKNKVHLYNSHRISYDSLVKDSGENVYLRGMIILLISVKIEHYRPLYHLLVYLNPQLNILNEIQIHLGYS